MLLQSRLIPGHPIIHKNQTMALRNLAKTSVLVIILVCAKFASNAQLRADFSASTVSGCAP
ncbi:MAG TPA: hypothetical protein DEU93_06430, partial [Chitinophagaceae bacterium]|nr:hypothetical protein [Chitinophagaceae bacterium]